jgi:hypothetical protein
MRESVDDRISLESASKLVVFLVAGSPAMAAAIEVEFT